MKTLIIMILLLLCSLFSPVYGVTDYYHLGVAAFQDDDYEGALIYLQEALGDKEDSYLYYLMGLSYLYLQEGVRARDRFKKSLELDPSFYLGYINLARTEILLENYQEGLALLNQALALEAHDFAVYHLKGRIYLNLKEWDEARDYFLKALELNPNNVYILNNLGLSYIYLGSFIEARRVLEAAIAKDPPLPYIYNNLGIVYENIGEIGKALSSYQRALEVDPDHFHARLNLLRLQN